MANDSGASELGDTQTEFIQQSKQPDKKPEVRDGVGKSGALGALRADNSSVQDRSDLLNLVAHGRKYRRHDTMEQVREARLKGPSQVNSPRSELNSVADEPQGANEIRQRQEQARKDVQAESDQLLADSVRRETNEETFERTETELLSIETAGVQATLLLGGEIPAEIDGEKIEAIAKGEHVNTEKTNNASADERKEYWNGENSPYKNMTFDQKMERWRGTMNGFLDQYKGKPEAEFFKRMNIDLENENAVSEIYNTYFVDGRGDVGLFASRIAENNTAEQIQENKAVIQYLERMYGDKSAKVAEQLVFGIKNAQTDIDLFMKSAQEDLRKGANMAGIDLIQTLYENGKQQSNKHGSERDGDKTKQEFKLNWNERTSSADKWTAGNGDLKIDGDFLAFNPHVNRLRNPYSTGTTEYDYFEKYQVKYFSGRPSDYFLDQQRRRVERGVQLAVNSEVDGELEKVLTPMFWEIIEADPESVSGEQFNRYITLDQGDNPVKSVNPVDLKIRNTDSTTREVDVNFSWGRLQVDKQTLIAVQQKAIDYIEGQVALGKIGPDMLAAARSIVESHRSPQLVKNVWPQKNSGGSSPEDPKTHLSFLRLNENWSKGTIKQEGDALIYTNEGLIKKN